MITKHNNREYGSFWPYLIPLGAATLLLFTAIPSQAQRRGPDGGNNSGNSRSAPAYQRPAESGSGRSYTPQRSEPSYTPQRSQPSYTPQRSEPSYTPQRSQPSYTPQRSEPSYTPQRSEPSYTPQRSQPSYTPQRSQPSYTPSRQTNGGNQNWSRGNSSSSGGNTRTDYGRAIPNPGNTRTNWHAAGNGQESHGSLTNNPVRLSPGAGTREEQLYPGSTGNRGNNNVTRQNPVQPTAPGRSPVLARTNANRTAPLAAGSGSVRGYDNGSRQNHPQTAQGTRAPAIAGRTNNLSNQSSRRVEVAGSAVVGRTLPSTMTRVTSRDVTVRNYGHAQDIFTRSVEGRQFNNGIVLSPARRINNTYINNYFGGDGLCYFPHYSGFYDPGVVYYSPYQYYGGICPPYIYSSFCWDLRPARVFVEIPIYVGGVWNGWYGDDSSDYYLAPYSNSDSIVNHRDPGFNTAVNHILDTFRGGNIQDMVDVTDPSVKIAVFLKGKYQYSMSSDDYLDITRDALNNLDTISFNLDRINRKASGVYAVSGIHIYADKNGTEHKVYVSFVLELIHGNWTLTQVDDSPGRL